MWEQQGQTSAQSESGRANSWIGLCPIQTALNSPLTWQSPFGQKSLFLVLVQWGKSSMITMKALARHECDRATCGKFLSLSPCQKHIIQQSNQSVEASQILLTFLSSICHYCQRAYQLKAFVNPEEWDSTDDSRRGTEMWELSMFPRRKDTR